MSGLWGHAIGVVIIVLIVLFLGVWAWAWLPRHRKVFDRMARVPLDNDASPRGGDGTGRVAGRGGDGHRTDNDGEARR